MPFSALLFASTSCFLFLASAVVGNDLKIVTRQSSDHGSSFTSTQYLSNSSSRSETGRGVDNMAGHRIADIVHYGATTNRRFVLDLDAHEYVTYETDKRGIMLGVKGRPVKYTGGRLDIWIENTDTGETREMFGHTARHIITKERRVPGSGACSSASEMDTDGWYIDYSILPEWRRPQAGIFSIAILSSSGCHDKIEVHRSGVEPGFPMKTTFTQHSRYSGRDGVQQEVTSTSTVEVIEFSEAPLDPALFEVPADFRKVSEFTSMNRPETPTPWERFKNWASEIFQ